MNAKKMLARYAQGGMVDEIGELRANMGGDISDARRMLQNLSSPVRHFANGGTLTPEEMQEESRKASRSQRDIEELQAIGLFDPARVPAAGKLTAEGEQLAKDRLAFWTSNKPDYVQNFGGAAALLNSIREDLATDPAGRYTPKAAPPPAPVKDTGATDKKDTGPLTTLTTSPVTTLTTSPITTLATSPVTTNPPIILPPTTALPPLEEVFVKPTAPLPEAPPVALTAGQEGLDPSTAIVKAIPQSERVAIPQLDTEFRASEPRTPTYDRFGRITGYTYSPAAKLTPATGTNVFNFVPPGITSRPRSLLNLGDVPGVMVDPVTGQMRLPLSASQQFARDRSTLDNQFRQLYARAAAGDKSIPAQAPASAAAAFRSFVMSGEDPMLQNKLRFRDIEQQKYDPTKADPALRAQYGQSAFVSDLAAAFDPFLARNRAALTSLAEQQTPKSYSEQYPDIAAAYAKLSEADKAKFPTLRDYELYHFDTYGRKEGRTSPLLGMGALQSPYAATFFSKGGEASTEDFIKKQSGGDVSRGTSEDDGERKQNIKLDSVQSLRDFLQSMPKEPPSSQPVEPDNVLPDVALKRKGAKELESYINALNPRAQVFDVPEGYQSSYRSSPFGLKGSGLVGSVPIREPDRINVLNTLTPGQRERVLLHEAEHSMSLRGGDIEGELDSKGRPIIMDNAFRAVALLKGNELPVREFVKNVALNKDKIDAFFGEPSFGSEFKKQSYEELRKRGRELALFEEQLASLSALEQATGKFLTQDKEMRKLLFPNTEMMSIFDALTGPRQTRMDARDLPPHTPINPMSYETGNAISRFIAEKTRKPLLRELPEAKMRVK